MRLGFTPLSGLSDVRELFLLIIKDVSLVSVRCSYCCVSVKKPDMIEKNQQKGLYVE